MQAIDVLKQKTTAKANSLDAVATDLAAEDSAFKTRSDYALEKICSEDDAFAAVDPVLADLKKQHKDLETQYNGTKEAFGDDDPMLDVLADQLDSARTAFDTRLLEVKRNKKQLALGTLLWLKAEREIRQRLKKKKQEFEEGMRAWSSWFKKHNIDLRKEQGLSALIWLLFIFYLMMQNKQRYEQQKRI